MSKTSFPPAIMRASAPISVPTWLRPWKISSFSRRAMRAARSAPRAMS